MTYDHIVVETAEGISTITFNRPKALNALNSSLLNEFDHALLEIAGNEDIRVLVLTGTGEKAFVAGADITELARLMQLIIQSGDYQRILLTQLAQGTARFGGEARLFGVPGNLSGHFDHLLFDWGFMEITIS